MKQFSADASHELRTPLTVMRSQLETALNSKITHLELKKIIANCLDETLRMSAIIENLLLLAKGDTGQDHLKQEKVDLGKLIRETYDESVIIASQKSITVTLDSPPHVIVSGDEQRLHQMLLNLIDNAVKYGRDRGTIFLRLNKEDGMAKIRVADDGIGISEHDMARIFDRFYRVDRARSRELGGVGLGLSIAKWIAETHGGTIGVASKVDKGSEFTVILPLSPQ
ncbi:MAG: ATP-binding protein [Ignavibacteriales bacterium]|nr:ATP-binding protein [Ignavibacteriales bacterium]